MECLPQVPHHHPSNPGLSTDLSATAGKKNVHRKGDPGSNPSYSEWAKIITCHAEAARRAQGSMSSLGEGAGLVPGQDVCALWVF
jgi:hypothetical protein